VELQNVDSTGFYRKKLFCQTFFKMVSVSSEKLLHHRVISEAILEEVEAMLNGILMDNLVSDASSVFWHCLLPWLVHMAACTLAWALPAPGSSLPRRRFNSPAPAAATVQ
jgi:hypothetical protein